MIFGQSIVLYILGEFEGDRMSPRESAKNGRNGAHRFNCIIFVNFELIFEILDENYHMKKILCPSDTFEIFVNFEILAIFEILNVNFR